MNDEQPAMPSTSNWVSPEEIDRERSYIESLIDELGGVDDYLDAILENQRLMAMSMQAMNQRGVYRPPAESIEVNDRGEPVGYPGIDVRPVAPEDMLHSRILPIDAVGVASQTTFENDTGLATFQVEGTVFADYVRAMEDVRGGEPVIVVGPGNIVRPISDVSTSILGLLGGISPDRFDMKETDENVEIHPGETRTVMKVAESNVDWVFTGTNDETYSLYQYRVDGEDVFSEKLKEPLGLYNDPYHFPTPLSSEREFSIEVTRQSDAGGPAEYFSKVGFQG